MYDVVSPSDVPVLQRAIGELRVDVRTHDGRTVLDGLRQVGCLKARFPRPASDGWMDIVTMNTSGGIAGGDVLDSTFVVLPRARATIAAQAAERYYRVPAGSEASRVQTCIKVCDGAAAEWLPQETILFDRCAMRRRLRIELAADAWFLGVESLVFGRAAMDEIVEHASLRDVIEVGRGGHLLLHDAIRLEGEVDSVLRQPAVTNGARAVATIVHVAPDAETKLDTLRALTVHAQFGASAWNGMLVARCVVEDSASLRSAVIAALRVLREERAPPRVWLC